MKVSTPLAALMFTVSLTVSISSGFAQADSGIKNDRVTPIQGNVALAGNKEQLNLGKEIPGTGSMSAVSAADATTTTKTGDKAELSVKEKRRTRRLKRSDRKEVTQVIGNSVDTYLANVYNVHTLQRF